MNTELLPRISRHWDEDIVLQLIDYIKIPAKSPAFDAQWQAHGHLDAAVTQVAEWMRHQPLAGLKVEIVRLPKRTPLLFFELPAFGSASSERTVLLYGHLDKQPEMTGWREGLGPWSPVVENGRLYGRGGADDGYAAFAAISALWALQQSGQPHARCVGLIETCEESGSFDLPAYLDMLMPRLGAVDFIVTLDSGCGDYERLWITTSLRGMAAGTLTVKVLTEGIHSGDASGIVPSSFRIARHLLDRLEDPASGTISIPTFHCDIPEQRLQQARAAAAILGRNAITKYPFVEGMAAATTDPAEALLNRTWRPALSVTGADGLPPVAEAGNVLRPFTALKLSLRLPPLVDGGEATAALKKLLEADPPYGASVTFEAQASSAGWNAAPLPAWLSRTLAAASKTFYGREDAATGEGGSIPFMNLLASRFPEATFLITGVLGPQANAHGPNEFLHLDYAKKLTACVAATLAAHASAD